MANPIDDSILSKTLKKIREGIQATYDKFVKKSGGLMSSLDTQASNVLKTLGQSRNYAEGIRVSFADAVPELAQISENAKDFEDTLKMAANAQMSINEALKTNILLTTSQLVALTEVQKAYGITKEELSTFVERFVTAGQSINNFPESLEKAANFSRAMGVNVDATMELIRKSLEDVNRYGFEDGVEGLGRMAARMAAMRVDSKVVFDFAEKVFDPENAISMVAGLQRMGVAVGDLADPFRLMYLASEDAEELQKQIGKATQGFTYFDEKSKAFKIAPQAKRDLRELEQLMGINYDELVKMSQAGERMRIVGSQIKIGGIDETTKQFISNISQFDEKKGGFTVKINQLGDTKLVSEINKDDIKAIEEANRELSPKDIAKAQLTSLQSIDANILSVKGLVRAPIAGSRIASSVAETMRGIGSATSATAMEIAPPRETRESINDFTSKLTLSFKDIISGTGGIKDVLDKFGSVGSTLSSKLEKVATGLVGIPDRPEFKQEIMSDNQLKALGSTLTSAYQESIQSLFKVIGIETKGTSLVQTINQNTNVKVEDIKVDLSGEIILTDSKGEKVVITPELKNYIETLIRTQIEKINNQNVQMLSVPATNR